MARIPLLAKTLVIPSVGKIAQCPWIPLSPEERPA